MQDDCHLTFFCGFTKRDLDLELEFLIKRGSNFDMSFLYFNLLSAFSKVFASIKLILWHLALGQDLKHIRKISKIKLLPANRGIASSRWVSDKWSILICGNFSVLVHLLEAICQHTEGPLNSVQKFLWILGQLNGHLFTEVMWVVAAARAVSEVQCQCLVMH